MMLHVCRKFYQTCHTYHHGWQDANSPLHRGVLICIVGGLSHIPSSHRQCVPLVIVGCVFTLKQPVGVCFLRLKIHSNVFICMCVLVFQWMCIFYVCVFLGVYTCVCMGV